MDLKLEMLYVVRDAICCMNIQFFFKQEKEKKVREKPDAVGATVTHCKLSKNITCSGSSTRAHDTIHGTPGGTVENSVAKLGCS